MDFYFPKLHLYFTRIGALSQPPELDALHNYLRNLRSRIENDIKDKTYLPLEAKQVPNNSLLEGQSAKPFVLPIHQIIKSIAGQSAGGDASSAQIAALNRRSRVVKNILKTLLRAIDPLVLLGDPGTGKTMTMQETAYNLAGIELRKVFPKITLFVRLGEFQQEEGRIGEAEVLDYVKRCSPMEIRPFIDDLINKERLVILFDGMDEMSRYRYNEYTEALSLFAGSRRGQIKTLFTCRITDFSPKFIHKRLVLLPFNRSQISRYLKAYLPASFVIIDEQKWTIRQLARRLSQDNLPVEAANPFVLWLLSFHFQEKGTWPNSRVELLQFYIVKNYLRKEEEAIQEEETAFPKLEHTLLAWSELAYLITSINRGSAINLERIQENVNWDASLLDEYIRVGKRCSILEESKGEAEYAIRFQHHRFQEFFAAYYIHHCKPAINWLDKMDAPRWQETMLNLVLMGEERGAVQALVEAINEPIKAFQAKEPAESQTQIKAITITEDNEMLLADRVELGTRILRQRNKNETSLKEHLMPCLENAVTFLIDKGNPITQVKMLNACINVSELNTLDALSKPLKSSVNWVRGQALAMIANNTNKGIGTNLVSEIGFDLANERLLKHVPAYWRSLIKNGTPGGWLSFFVAILLSVFQLIILPMGLSLVIFYAIYEWQLVEAIPEKVISFSPNLNETFLSLFRWEYSFPIFGFILLGGSSWILKTERESGSVLVWTLGGSLVLIQLCFLITALWFNLIELKELIAGLFGMMLANIIVIGGAIALLSILVNFLCLSLYLMLFFLITPKKQSLKTFYRSAASMLSFELNTLTNLGVYSLAIASIVGIILLIGKIEILKNIGDWIETIFLIIINLVIGIGSLVLIVVYITQFLNRLKEKKYQEIYQDFKETGTFILIILTVLAVMFLIGAYSFYVLKIVLVVIAISVLAVLIYLLRNLIDLLNNFLRQRMRPYPFGYFKRSFWINKLESSNPAKQKELLLRTTNQSLSMDGETFLELLKEVREKIKEEPAQSTYWEKRNQLEAILKQERLG